MSGTVVMSGDRKFVKIDGSEALTPVFETVDIQEGDRVYVSIENHQASVIGNYSYPPSARVANQANAMAADGILKVDALTAISITTENLTAHSATITNLVAQNINAGYAKITELDALKANIETLSGDVLNYKNATFEQLNAANGRIDNLSGDVLSYKNATFEQLEAAEGKITKLEGDVVSYKNATFEYMHANFAEIDLSNIKHGSITTAMLGDAVITTAQIADGSITNLKVANDLDATKITVGTLSVDRLVIRGSEKSIVYELNNISGALQSTNVDTLNGEIITPRTITADKIVANSITGNEIAAQTILANNINVTDLFAQDISATGSITGMTFFGATGDFTGTVTATKLIAITTGKISIFDFNEYGMSVDFTGNNVKDYAFSKDYFCARVFNKSNVERAYFYMDTEDSVSGINGRAIIYANDEISLRVPSTGVVTVTNESTMVKTIYINPNGDIFKNGYNLALSNGSKTIILRNDTSYFRILIGDDLADNTFTWNSLRPFNIDLSNGKVSINNGLEASSVVATTFQAGNSTTNGGIELYHSTPFIDFHFGRDASDFTARLIEEEKGILRLVGAFRVSQIIHMGPTNGGYERSIRFNVTTGTYQHHASLYGGNPGSTTAIGCYDNKNGRGIWAYNDVDNYMYITPTIRTGEHSGGWIDCLKGRAALYVEAAGGASNFNALSTIRAKAGAWSLGVLNTSSDFYFAYGNETIVTGTANAITRSFKFGVDGAFIAQGTIVSTSANAFRLVGSDYGVVLHNNSTGFYILFTNSGDQYGNYNSLRPVEINSGTGAVYLNQKAVAPPSGDTAIRGNGDATHDCGHTNYLWKNVYSKNGVKTTSDEREKDILNFNLSELSDCFMSLEPIAFRWAYGNDRKIHLGVGAQTTERKMIEAGYDPSQFDMIQHDELEERSVSGLMERYGINYQDLNILTMMQTQKTTREFTTFLKGFKKWKDTVDVDLSLFEDEQVKLKEEVQNLKIELALANQKIAELSAKTA